MEKRVSKFALIHKKHRDGDELTDNEVLDGYKYFTELKNVLGKGGDIFYTAFIEANRMSMRLEDIALARKLIKV
jgi:hypothetical protein